MDNFKIDIVCTGEEALKSVLQICDTQHHKCVGCRIDEKYGLVLYWTDSSREGYVKNLFDHDLDDTVRLISGWLKKFKTTELDEYFDDSDVWMQTGWRAYNEDWGHVDGEYQAFLAIRPHAAWYGK